MGAHNTYYTPCCGGGRQGCLVCEKHPDLCEFIGGSETAVIRITFSRYILAAGLQDVSIMDMS